jgi:glycerol uptake facilitator-like aquaporin
MSTSPAIVSWSPPGASAVSRAAGSALAGPRSQASMEIRVRRVQAGLGGQGLLAVAQGEVAVEHIQRGTSDSIGTALLVARIFAVIGMSLGVNAGYAINPARDLGPRLFAWAQG